MRVALLRVLFVAAGCAVALPSRLALADAVPPEPLCPPGQVGVTSHRGPACVLAAPKHCPPGYRGELGGTCALAPCASDRECDADRRCFQVEACQELRELHWTGFDWSVQPGSASSHRRAPQPAPEGSPPKLWVKRHVCGQEDACEAPAQCRPTGLCYPPSLVGKTKTKVVAAAPVPEDLPPGVFPYSLIAPDAKRKAAEPTPASLDKSDGSCRKGCSVASTPRLAVWLGLPLLVAAAWWHRRGQRARGR